MTNVIPQLYDLTTIDVAEIKHWGYEIVGDEELSLEAFITKYFPNFNLRLLLNEVEIHFAPTTKLLIKRRIIMNRSALTLIIEFKNAFVDENEALLFIRKFRNTGEIVVSHEYCVIPLEYRGMGLIKPVFRESLQQYVNMHASRIEVHAGLADGGYAWAKHGFAAVNKKEVDAILRKAEMVLFDAQYKAVKRIHEIYYGKKPNGADFPIELWAAMDFMKPVLRGSHWHGALDLKSPAQFNNFRNYVFRQ